MAKKGFCRGCTGILPQASGSCHCLAALQELTGRVEASFILDRLDYMKMGGRCSAVTLLGANLLKHARSGIFSTKSWASAHTLKKLSPIWCSS